MYCNTISGDGCLRRECSGIKSRLFLCADMSEDGRLTTAGDEKLDAMMSSGDGWESAEFIKCNCAQDKLRKLAPLLID